MLNIQMWLNLSQAYKPEKTAADTNFIEIDVTLLVEAICFAF
jgi:hypothetical protein